MLPGSPSSKVRWSRPKDSAIWSQSSGNIRRGGSREGDREQVAALGQALAGAQVERHARPAPVVDEGLERDERLGVRVRGDAVLVAVAVVLAADDVRPGSSGGIESKTFSPLDAERLRLQRGRRLHRDEAEHLEEVGDDHVAEGARLLVEARRASRSRASPGRRSGRGRCGCGSRPARTCRWRSAARAGSAPPPAEVVVDAEDLRLVEDRVQERVQLAGRGEVGAERLLEDDPRPRRRAPSLPSALDRPAAPRRQREVVQQPRSPPSSSPRPARPRSGRRASKPSPTEANRSDSAKRSQAPVAGSRPQLLDRRRAQAANSSSPSLAPRGADDDEALRHQPRLREVEHPRQQLAPRQVAGRPEEDDHVILRSQSRGTSGKSG